MKKCDRNYVICLGLLCMLSGLSACGSQSDFQQQDNQQQVSEASETLQMEQDQNADNPKREDATKSDAVSDKVASSSDMTTVEDVVEDWMTPIDAGQLKDGEYEVSVSSSSGMFQIDSCLLSVADGQMWAVLSMNSSSYLYLYPGTAQEAASAQEESYIPAKETEEGMTTFRMPVKALDEGISCAAFSRKKELWYDRTLVFRSDSLKSADGSNQDAFKEGTFATAESLGLGDGVYWIDVQLFGGSGKARLESPAKLEVSGNEMYVTLVWGSSNYDYMLAADEKFEPINTEGNSVFRIPVEYLDRRIGVIADTTAMSQPHEIAYTLYLDSSTLKEDSEISDTNQ